MAASSAGSMWAPQVQRLSGTGVDAATVWRSLRPRSLRRGTPGGPGGHFGCGGRRPLVHGILGVASLPLEPRLERPAAEPSIDELAKGPSLGLPDQAYGVFSGKSCHLAPTSPDTGGRLARTGKKPVAAQCWEEEP